jgi:hypothetical protein
MRGPAQAGRCPRGLNLSSASGSRQFVPSTKSLWQFILEKLVLLQEKLLKLLHQYLKRKLRKVMTKQEAINVLDGFRKASRTLDPTKAMQAFNALMNADGAVTTSFNLAGDFSHALATLRSVFDAMERKGIQFPSN